jgi:hypothetical protein
MVRRCVKTLGRGSIAEQAIRSVTGTFGHQKSRSTIRKRCFADAFGTVQQPSVMHTARIEGVQKRLLLAAVAQK